MARDVTDTQPIESRDELVAWFEAGSKPNGPFRVGTEHEKIPFYAADRTPVPYEGPRGIRALLEGMQARLGWEPIHGGTSHHRPLRRERRRRDFARARRAVRIVRRAGRHDPPDLFGDTHAHLAQVKEIAEPLGIGFLDLGMSPLWTRDETPVMPKGRYKIMIALHAEGGLARPRHDVPHRDRAGQSRFRRAKPTW
jgi:glutamate--cysteine ligase